MTQRKKLDGPLSMPTANIELSDAVEGLPFVGQEVDKFGEAVILFGLMNIKGHDGLIVLNSTPYPEAARHMAKLLIAGAEAVEKYNREKSDGPRID